MDQAHDALHADVLEVLQANGAAARPSRATALEVLRADVTEYRVNVDRAGRPPLAAPLSCALVDLRPVQLAYADHALSLGEQPTPEGAAEPALAAFQRSPVGCGRSEPGSLSNSAAPSRPVGPGPR